MVYALSIQYLRFFNKTSKHAFLTAVAVFDQKKKKELKSSVVMQIEKKNAREQSLLHLAVH